MKTPKCLQQCRSEHELIMAELQNNTLNTLSTLLQWFILYDLNTLVQFIRVQLYICTTLIKTDVWRCPCHFKRRVMSAFHWIDEFIYFEWCHYVNNLCVAFFTSLPFGNFRMSFHRCVMKQYSTASRSFSIFFSYCRLTTRLQLCW